MRFKFVDDLSISEKLNLILLGLSSYNFKNHVASDIGINQKYLSSDLIHSQEYFHKIEDWILTEEEVTDLERVNTVAFKIILQDN